MMGAGLDLRSGRRTRPGRILRFTGAERALHWAIAVPFMVCLATAAVLFFYYNPDPLRPHRAIVSWAHRISGICLIVLPLLVVVVCRRSWAVFWQNMKEGWVWTFADVKWLLLMPLSVLFKRIALPEEGKFNAAEKLNFMMVTVACPALAVTGLAIWLTKLPFLPWMIHLGITALVIPLALGHKFMALVNPGTRIGLSGMFSGWVDRAWAKHHYRRWFRENFEQVTASAAPPPPAPRREVMSSRAPIEAQAPQIVTARPHDSHARALFRLALHRQRAGMKSAAKKLGRDAVKVSLTTGDLAQAALIFCNLGQNNRLKLDREEILTIAAELRRQSRPEWAAHAYSVLLSRNRKDQAAMAGLLELAQAQRGCALRIYSYLLERAPSVGNHVIERMRKVVEQVAA